MSPKRKRWFWAVGLAVLGVASLSLALIWSVKTYLEVVRLEVRIADACSRVEAAGRQHSELAGNLLTGGRRIAATSAARGAALERARARALDGSLDPDRVRQGDGTAEFREIHLELTAAVAQFRAGASAWTGAGVGAALSGLDAGLERSEVHLNESLLLLERSVDAYRAAIGRFPASIVTAVTSSAEAEPRAAWATAGGAPVPRP